MRESNRYKETPTKVELPRHLTLVQIGIEELYEKIESTNFITSPAINPDTGEEGLKDILDVVRSKKEVIKEQ